MHFYRCFFVLIVIVVGESFEEKIHGLYLKEHSVFLNFGDKKLSKLNKTLLENSLLKSKVDVLGDVFKKSIDEIKSTDVMDLVFLIDASSSVGEENFQSELKFVKKFLSDVTVDYNHTRVAIITFSSSNTVFKNVDEITEPSEKNNKCLLLNKQLGNITYTGGGTHTLGAFKLAEYIFKNSRNESKKVLFLITDGFSNGGDPVPVANQLKQKGVIIFTLGIQNGNYKELYELASSPGETHSYLLDSFQEFESLARRALHVDLQSGDYIPLGIERLCDDLCDSGSCCDDLAVCTCGTSSGQYSCVCQPGYYGSGLKNSCSPCPSGTYADGPNVCVPCPDMNHVTTPPAVGLKSCKCKLGYQPTSDNKCEVTRCPELVPPENGYFVKKKECNNVLYSACGIRCDVGYTLSGSSIRLCQQNGTWSGKEPSCHIRSCTSIIPPPHSEMKCENEDIGRTYEEDEKEMPVDTVCTFKCRNGRSLIGSHYRTCLPLAQWDGIKTTCKQLKCNRLPKLPFVVIEPSNCTIGKQPYGRKCKISCMDGFQLKGPEEKYCTGLYGTWTNGSVDSVCEDVTPPIIQCPDNVKGFNLPKKKFGVVSWVPPKATDNSGLEITTWTKPSIKVIQEFKFKIGTTTVTYFAQDSFKNTAKCNFTVEIEDNEQPTIEDCESPAPFLSPDPRGANVSWEEPNIFDNSQQVLIRKSHDFGFFPIGTTDVTYTAVDGNNNTNTCVLNITVQVSQCDELEAPSHGQADCNTNRGSKNCVITCQEGYAVPLNAPFVGQDSDNSSVTFICEDSEPMWFNNEGLLFPECTITEVPDEIVQEGVITLETDKADDICKDMSKLDELENEIRNNLIGIFDDCTPGVDCKVQAVAQCEIDQQSEEEKSNRIRRSTYYQQKNAKGKKLKYKDKIQVHFQLNSKVNKKEKHKYKNKSLEMQNKVRRMDLFKDNGTNVAFAFKFKDPSVICPLGFATKKTKCVQCPPGTFHNITRKLCQSCPLGQYNENNGQIECRPCPSFHSTRRVGAKSLSQCVEQCNPGTIARKKTIRRNKRQNVTEERITLKPFCRSCPIGQYQNEYGQLKCIHCPKGYTTTHRGAKSINQCIPTLQQICSNQTNICNNGYCIIENDYYSCNCHNNYIGNHCEISLNSCHSNPCINNGDCKPHPSEFTKDFTCVCKEGFFGKYCEEELERCPLKCVNKGSCVQDDDENKYICLCPRGFSGPFCELRIRNCRINVCENNGRCIEQYDGFKCECINGYLGKRCHLLPCDYQPCHGNASCLNLVQKITTRDSFMCECPSGYAGIDCSIKISYCKINPCLNGGTCQSMESSYKCKCSRLYYGKNCEHLLHGNYILSFPKSSTTDFIPMEGFKNNLTGISVCLWMQTLDNFNYGTILSYATKKYDNTFTLTDYTGLVVYINNKNIITDVHLNDGRWHYFCFTWSGTDGSYMFYLDGEDVVNGTNFLQGEHIEGGGKLVIGQEQDVLGGRFSQSESFLGKMAHLDFWSKVLTKEEVNHNMLSCREDIHGDLYTWNEFRLHKKGDVQVSPSTFCKNCEDPKYLINGYVSVRNNTAYYKCYKGYELVNGYPNGRKCNKAAKWEGIQEPYCKKVYCGPPRYFRNGYVIGRRYNYEDRLIYRCNIGYNMSGLSIRHCSEYGTWVPDEPRCLGGQCEPFHKPDYAHIKVLPDDSYEEYLEELNEFDAGTQLEFSCENGTNLVGEKILTCKNGGIWDSTIPSCTKIVSTTTTTSTTTTEKTTTVLPSTTMSTTTTQRSIPSTSKIVVPPTTSITSTTTTTTERSTISTTRITLPTVGTSTTTSTSTTTTRPTTTITSTTTTTKPSTTTTIRSSSATTTRPSTTTTTKASTTSTTTPSTTTTTIPSTTTTTRPSTTITTKASTTSTTPSTTSTTTTKSTTATITAPSTTRTTTTTITPSTSSTTPKMVPNIKTGCDPNKIPLPPLNGYVIEESIEAFKNGSSKSIFYKCRFGYNQVGGNETTCIIDGYWTEINMTCNLIPCPNPPKIKLMNQKHDNVSLNGYFFGNMVMYQCIEGYKLFGTNAIRCSTSGRWTRMQGKCARISCFRPIVGPRTTIEGTSYLYQDQVTIICKNKTKYTLTCGSDGKWKGDRGPDC